MEDALKQLVPIYAFMLIPIWIPLVAAAMAALGGLLPRSRPATAASTATAASRRKHLAQPLAAKATARVRQVAPGAGAAAITVE